MTWQGRNRLEGHLEGMFSQVRKPGKGCPSYLEKSVKEGTTSCQMPQQAKDEHVTVVIGALGV